METNRDVFVGFLHHRPHVQRAVPGLVISAYLSKAAAKRAYADVRKARLVFDAEVGPGSATSRRARRRKRS